MQSDHCLCRQPTTQPNRPTVPFPCIAAADNSLLSLTSAPQFTQTGRARVRRNCDGQQTVNDYILLKELGRGTCGTVSLAFEAQRERLVAVKAVERADQRWRLGGPSEAQQRFQSVLREVEVMKALRHRNVVRVHEIIDDPTAEHVYIVMQYVDDGPIATIDVRDDTDRVCAPIAPPQLAGMMRQMLAGLEYLHNHNVVHRDIKPENILVDRRGHVYLADFGVAETFDTQHRARRERMMQARMMQASMVQSMAQSMAQSTVSGPRVLGTKGTMLFIAPELYDGQHSYGKPVDMWAMGVTLFTLLTGRLPFVSLAEIADPALPAIPKEYGPHWSQFLRGLLDRNPDTRYTATQARAVVKAMTGDTSPVAGVRLRARHDNAHLDSLTATDSSEDSLAEEDEGLVGWHVAAPDNEPCEEEAELVDFNWILCSQTSMPSVQPPQPFSAQAMVLPPIIRGTLDCGHACALLSGSQSSTSNADGVSVDDGITSSTSSPTEEERVPRHRQSLDSRLLVMPPGIDGVARAEPRVPNESQAKAPQKPTTPVPTVRSRRSLPVPVVQRLNRTLPLTHRLVLFSRKKKYGTEPARAQPQ